MLFVQMNSLFPNIIIIRLYEYFILFYINLIARHVGY